MKAKLRKTEADILRSRLAGQRAPLYRGAAIPANAEFRTRLSHFGIAQLARLERFSHFGRLGRTQIAAKMPRRPMLPAARTLSGNGESIAGRACPSRSSGDARQQCGH
ncbi:hypothetical protein [Pandoraea anhela]|uniref:hypothetical protein n=1 Tax=Pandoraea anhela TaxID=2508295 RepID=UPI0012418556|nr:hypothetical protein [Pandoraea anhela]